VRDLKRQGVAILFVSHRMEEVFEIADKITVFRDGRLISTRPRAEATPQRAIADMVGREIDLTRSATSAPRGPAAVGGGSRRHAACSRASASISSRRGARLRRADRRGPHRCRARAVRHRAGDIGTIRLGGKPITIRSPREA
jgi:rhamnose transport system ATP-binding protein